MPRRLRVSMGGFAYHVLNRAVGRGQLFDEPRDFAAMEQVIARTHELLPIRIISYCLMPNHWHFVLWPMKDGELSEFMRLLTVTHTQRRHAHHHSAGTTALDHHYSRVVILNSARLLQKKHRGLAIPPAAGAE